MMKREPSAPYSLSKIPLFKKRREEKETSIIRLEEEMVDHHSGHDSRATERLSESI